MSNIFVATLSGLDRTLHIRLYGLHGLRDLLRELARFLGELPDLLGNDGKAASVLTRTRRLDGRVEREQVRLLCNAADDLDAVADLLGALTECRDCGIDGLRTRLDLLHVVHDLVDGAAPLLHAFHRLVRDLCNLTRLLGHARSMARDRDRRIRYRGGGIGLTLHALGNLRDRHGNVVGRLRRLLGCLGECFCRG